MKIYSLIIILSIFGFLLSSSVIDVEYLSEYVVNVEEYSEGYIPKLTSLYFRIKLNPNKNITLELKTLESDNYYYYSVEAYGYEEKPSDEEATKKSGYKLDLDIKTFKYEAIYQSGIYQFGQVIL